MYNKRHSKKSSLVKHFFFKTIKSDAYDLQFTFKKCKFYTL